MIATAVRRVLFGVGPAAACRAVLRRVALRMPSDATAPHPFDLARGIDTAGFRSWRALRSGQAADPYNAGYLPAEPEAAQALLSRVPDRATYTLVDLGCGKGRVLALAAEAGFRRVIGIEINAELAKIALQNAARLTVPGGVPVEIWNADAATVALPSERLVLFLNHPFWGPVMDKVAANLARSLAEAPRPVFVLYVNPFLAGVFDAISALERVHAGAEGVVWRSRS